MYACIHLPRASEGEHSRLSALAQAFSPKVEIAAPDTAVIDIAPLRRLFGGPDKIASEIAREAHKMKLEGNISIAANPDIAILAARNLPGVTILPPGEEGDILAGLRLSALPIDGETLETLHRWGVRTLGEFRALPPDGIAERLGQRGLEILKLARGETQRPVKPDLETTSYAEKIDLEDPVLLLEPLLFLLSRALNDICGRLSRQSMATTEIRLTLDLVTKPAFGRVLQLPFATRDARALLKLLQLDLEAHPPGAPVRAVTLELVPVEPRIVQGDLYEPPKPEPEKLELTLGKIRAMVGVANAGSPRLSNTHRRDAWKMLSTPPGPSLVLARQPHARLQLAFRYWRPPVAARVEVQDGLPRRVSSRSVQGVIEQAAGPWRSSGDWWAPNAWDREEWDIGIAGGALYRLVRVIALREWILEGSYD